MTATLSSTELIWREFHERLRAFVSRRVVRPADAEDIVQDVFVRIHRGIDTLRNRERLSAWIFQIARNAIADHYRGGARAADGLPEDFDPPEPSEDSGGTEARELAGCLRPMIAELPESYREAIVLTEIEGLTQAEAAARIGLSLTGMKSRVQRARQQLKKMLLGCCRVQLDRRGGVAGYSPNPGTCGGCSSSRCDR